MYRETCSYVVEIQMGNLSAPVDMYVGPKHLMHAAVRDIIQNSERNKMQA